MEDSNLVDVNRTVLFEMPVFGCGNPECTDKTHTARWAVGAIVAENGEEKWRDMCWTQRDSVGTRLAHAARVYEAAVRESSLVARSYPEREQLSNGWWGKPRPVVSIVEGKGK